MKKAIVLLMLMMLLVAGGYFGRKYYIQLTEKQIACIMEAKICPDGSSVGRTGPNCEFTVCPDITAGWETLTNGQYGFELKYPSDFFEQSQPPRILVGNCNYSIFPDKCPDIKDIVAKDMIDQGGDAAAIENNLSSSYYWDNPSGLKQTVDNVVYCLYTTGDAAAGHAFNNYYFATIKNQKCIVAYLITSTANCDFYLPLEKGNTEQANNYNNCLKTNKDQPIILNEVINTFKFSK